MLNVDGELKLIGFLEDCFLKYCVTILSTNATLQVVLCYSLTLPISVAASYPTVSL